MEKYNRNQPLHQTEITTSTTKPYKPSVNLDITRAVIRQSMILGVIGFCVSVWVMLFATDLPVESAVVPLVVGLALPWLRLLLADHGDQGRVSKIRANEQRIILAQQEVALLALVGDVNGDGRTTSADAVLQQQREDSLAEFVRQVFLFSQSPARHAWEAIGFDEWQRVVDECIRAGLFTTSLDKANKRHTRKVSMTYPSALTALRNSGSFKVTPLNDLLPQAGPSVKDSSNAIASDQYDGPVTSMEE